jgi:hypothetical protein
LQKRLKAFTLQEIKDEIKTLNQKKAPGHDLIAAKMLKELPTRRTHKPHVYIQCHTTTRILASIIKVCTNNDTQTLGNPKGRFFLQTNQLIADNIKSTRKTYTQRNK